MSRRTQRLSRRYRLRNGVRPDFARIYGSDTALPTPRMAHALWRATREFEAVWHANYDDPDDLETLLLDLPECAERAADQAWLSRFNRRIRLVRASLEVADLSRLPDCVGDELALYLVFDHASTEVFLWQLDNDDYHQQLPACRYDEWFRGVAEILFPDSCVAELLEYAEDGGVYDEPSIKRRMTGTGIDNWFPCSMADRSASQRRGDSHG